MYTQELNTFITVAELGSFSAASRKLYISKSAIMQQINLLEKKIDCILFDRNSHGVYLTEAGKIFLIQARKIQHLFIETNKIMQNYKNTIIVGTGYLSTTNFLEDYWNKFSKNQSFKLQFKEIQDSYVIFITQNDVRLFMPASLYLNKISCSRKFQLLLS